MYITIDFNSDEAIYVQLCNRIIMQIATEQDEKGIIFPQSGKWLIISELICTLLIRLILF